MTISKEEFQEWKNSFATKAFFSVVIARIEESKEILSVSAGREPTQDSEIVGMIRAFREVLGVSWEDTE